MTLLSAFLIGCLTFPGSERPRNKMKSFPGWLGAPWPPRRLPSPAPVPSSGVDTPQDSVSRVQVELTKQYIKEGEKS